MKKLFLLITLMFPVFLYGQEEDKELRNYIVGSSKGLQTRFIDTKLPDLELNDQFKLEFRIRCFIKSSTNDYYLYIAEQDKTDGISLLIEKDCVPILIDAMKGQILNYKWDIEYSPDYLENKYTVNGFTIGYTLEKSDIQWFVKLKGGTDVNVYTDIDIQKIYDSFVNASEKMQKVKKDYFNNMFKY